MDKVEGLPEADRETRAESVTDTQLLPFGEREEFVALAPSTQKEGLTRDLDLLATCLDLCRGQGVGRRSTPPEDGRLRLRERQEGVGVDGAREGHLHLQAVTLEADGFTPYDG